MEMLLVPAQERDGFGGDVAEPDLAPLPDPDRYTEAQWEQTDALLELEDVPRRLSGLLAEARAIDPDLTGLLVLRALHAFSPEVGAAVPRGERQVLLAVDDGTGLEDAEYGGADLLVASARITNRSTEDGAVA